MALSQKIADRCRLDLPLRWVWATMAGIGIPFVADVLFDELGGGTGQRRWLLLITAGGAICGLLQASALHPHISRVYW